MQQVAYVAEIAEQWPAADAQKRQRLQTLSETARVVYYRMKNLYREALETTGNPPGNPLFIYTFSKP
jgi:hypothetical protein